MHELGSVRWDAYLSNRGQLDATQAPSAFSGFIAYDTSSQDQLAQLNFGRFILEDWNILVDVNLGGVVASFPRLVEGGTGVAFLEQGLINGAFLNFENAAGIPFGLPIGFPDADPNMPWVFPSGALLTFGYAEGIISPDDINDSTTALNPGSQNAVIPDWRRCWES